MERFKRAALIAVPLVLLFSSSAYGGEKFEEIYSALRDDASVMFLSELEDRYKGEFISGSGYIRKIEEVWGDTILYLAAEKEGNLSGASPVAIKIFLKKEFRDTALRAEEGEKIFFFGTFRDIIGKTMVIREGSITE